MPLPFLLHATGTGKINVGAAPSTEALLLFNLSWQTQRRKAECFYGIFLEVQKSQTDFKGRARRKPDMRKEIFRAQSAVANTAMI